MNNSTSAVCRCGRIGEHCPNSGCGSRNKHPLVQRTFFVSQQLGRDVRYYRCRKCGTEYGYIGSTLYDMECNAPEDIRMKQKQVEPEDEVRMIKEAIAFLESKGLKVSMNDTAAIEAPVINESKPELVIQKITSGTNGAMDELPPGWSYNDKDQKVGPLSMDDLFKSKEPSENESNS